MGAWVGDGWRVEGLLGADPGSLMPQFPPTPPQRLRHPLFNDSALPEAVIGNTSGKNSLPTTPATLPPDTPEPPDNRTRARILPASCSHRAPETAVRAVEYCRRSRRFAVFAEVSAQKLSGGGDRSRATKGVRLEKQRQKSWLWAGLQLPSQRSHRQGQTSRGRHGERSWGVVLGVTWRGS
jgi:hypothetical protein